jgi:thioredoxin reductase
MKINDVVIIGAGPAGLAAAIQLKRFGITPVIFERDQVGGLLRNANLVENYLGFPEGISGRELIKTFIEHFNSLSLKIFYEEVELLTSDKEIFCLMTSENEYQARTIVIASGTIPRRFQKVVIEPDAEARVFYEVFPLLEERDKEIAIVGAGDAAFDNALNLSRHNRVTIFNRGNSLKCLPLLWQRVQENERIQYVKSVSVKKVRCQEKGLILELEKENGTTGFFVNYLLGVIGRGPNLEFISEQTKSIIEKLIFQGRLHLIGDVKNDIYRQVSIAAGDGIKAAMKIYQALKETH